MNFSAARSLFTNLVLKLLGSIFGSHTDSSIRIYDTVSFSNGRYYHFSAVTFSNYITHILGKL